MTSGQRQLLIVWHDSFATGINIVDEQHRGLVAIINTLHYSLVVQHDASRLRSIFDMIFAYAKVHFNTERELMDASAYPRINDHILQHENFKEEVTRIFVSCLDEGGDAQELLEFLKYWWKEHILKTDMAFSGHILEYFRSHHRIIKKR
jgi:hemerythrin-like metal-binding protein